VGIEPVKGVLAMTSPARTVQTFKGRINKLIVRLIFAESTTLIQLFKTKLEYLIDLAL
jgi:hypothetical protein